MFLLDKYNSEIRSIEKERDEFYEQTKELLKSAINESLGSTIFFEDETKPFSENLKKAIKFIYEVMFSIENGTSRFDGKIIAINKEIERITSTNDGGDNK